MEIIIGLLIGIVLGVVTGLIIGKGIGIRRSEEIHSKTIAQIENIHRETIEHSDRVHDSAIERLNAAHQDALRTQQKNCEQAIEALRSKFDETINRLEAEMRNTTNDMLKERQKEFSETSRQSVESLLTPLRTSIADMKSAIADNTSRHDALSGMLSENIKRVLEQSESASRSANRLADILRGGGRIQGSWGESVLQELLTSQGLTEGIHYELQSTLRDNNGRIATRSDGQSMRPDVILHLDSERDIIIDAKVSLTAFMDYMEASDEEGAEKALTAHIQSIENHVKELVRKDYSSYIVAPRSSVNYVIMFVPYTAALYAALKKKPDLWRRAMEKGVYIADEQTLYAALKIVDLTWSNIRQAENHMQVFSLANEMLDRVQSFMAEYEKIGVKLDEAVRCFEIGRKKLESGGQSIPKTCGKLIALGAKYSKPQRGISPSLLGLNED